jgi:hypothetical protein
VKPTDPQPGGNVFDAYNFTRQVIFVVKNVGGQTATFDVHLVTVSAD